MNIDKIRRMLWKFKRRMRLPSKEEKETYLRLIGYTQELMKAYKEMMEYLLERLKGRKEYWQGHTAGLRVKPPDKDTLLELQIAQARLEELSQFLGWLETASNKLNKEVLKVSDKLEEEIKRLFPN